jgi:hypothetical protein
LGIGISTHFGMGVSTHFYSERKTENLNLRFMRDGEFDEGVCAVKV